MGLHGDPFGKRRLRALAWLGAAAISFTCAAAAEAQIGTRAGVAAAVSGPAHQVSLQQRPTGRRLASGDAIFVGRRIITGPASNFQIILLDGTTLTVGLDSAIVIEEFAFDTSSGDGKLTVAIERGALRLVSGRLGRVGGDAIRVKLPVAIVTVHGSIAMFSDRFPSDPFTSDLSAVLDLMHKTAEEQRRGAATRQRAGRRRLRLDHCGDRGRPQ
jgi:hypothetical protein